MNEILYGMFMLLMVVQFVTAGWVLLRINDPEPIDIIISLISTIFGYVNSNMILNGNVNLYTVDTSFVPIQSLPLHYLLLMLAAFMTVVTIYVVVMVVRNIFSQKNNSIMKNWMEEA